jgi:hypothetical protein
MEEALELVKIDGGQETCTVAFTSRALVKDLNVMKHVGKFVQVIDLYKDSENQYKRQLSHRNYGMALVQLLKDVDQEGG